MRFLLIISCFALVAQAASRWPPMVGTSGHLDLKCNGHQNSTNGSIPICQYPHGVNETGHLCNITQGWNPTVWICSREWWNKFSQRSTIRPAVSSTTTSTRKTTTQPGTTSPLITGTGQSTSPTTTFTVSTASSTPRRTSPTTPDFNLELDLDTSSPNELFGLKTLTPTTLRSFEMLSDTTTTKTVLHENHSMCWLLIFILLIILFLIFIYWILQKIKDRRRRPEFSVLFTRNPGGCNSENIYESV